MTRCAGDVARQIEKAVQHLNALLAEASGENDVTVVLWATGGIAWGEAGEERSRSNAKPWATEPLKLNVWMAIE